MSTILWDTNGTEIVKTLSAERRAAGALASGLALTLVVVTEEEYADEAQEAATTAASAHPCRLLVVVRRRVDADDRLDAEVQVGGRLGANEAVMMRMYGRLSLHAESVVLPLLASDAPVVTWWHGSTPDRLAWDALGVLAGRRVTDAVFSGDDPIAALRRRAKDYAPGDTDLAWTRATPWRALLASAFDDMPARPTSAEVQAQHANPSAALIAGWLTSRLGIKVKRSDSGGPGVTAVDVRFEGKERLRIDRPDGYLATLSRTGISDRQLPLKRRGLGELLAEELRRLDADEVYGEALSVVTGVQDLANRPPMRTLIWRDPEKRVTRKATPAPPKASRSAAAAKAGLSSGDTAVKKATKRKSAQSGKAAAGTAKRTAKKVAARRAATKKG
ncbi:MAG TPA: glucose-6-phosphate dehydrogenase assembly protein OpcA [Actinomycetes bacterium]|jgi:glucose-6-phosphate dehydrogenase assembly protein OpcA|nr:glucose-6-phosphate dehydrogenase assembly protein OpcA [Actinomycetes bacterium]